MEINLLRAALELRRKHYLRYYYAGLGAAMALLATSCACPEYVLHGLQALMGVHAPVKASDIIAYRVFALIGSLGITLGPVMGYRGERGFSVERAVFTRILGYFGDFSPAPGGAIHAAEVRKAELFAEPLLFYPEEGVMGQVSGVRVRLCNATFFKRESGRDLAVFSGLFILCDMPQGAPPADQALIHRSLEGLADTVKTLPRAKAHWDDRLAYGAAALVARMRESVLSRMAKNELPAEKSYRLKYGKHPLLTRPRADSGRVGAVFEPYGVECSSNRCLAAVAGRGTFFVLGSLFAPALDREPMQRLYDVMENVHGLAGHLRKA